MIEEKGITHFDDRLRDIEYQLQILWSTLEAIRDAGDGENRVLETYLFAIYGAADKAFAIKQEFAQLIEETEIEETTERSVSYE